MPDSRYCVPKPGHKRQAGRFHHLPTGASHIFGSPRRGRHHTGVPAPFPTMLLITKALLIKLLIAASAGGVIYALC